MSERKKLKILFLPAWYTSKKNPVEGIFIKEHARAVSLFNEIIVIYNEGADRCLKNKWEVISDKLEEGIRTIRVKHRKSFIPKTTYFLYLLSIKKVFDKLLKEGWRPDIIHAHVYSAGVPAIILGKKYKIPVIITEHFTGFPRKILNKIEILKARFAMNKADIILPVSKSLMAAIKSYGIKNNFEVVPNVVNTEIFYPIKNKINNKKKKILTVALLHPKKGIFYLLKAISKLKKIRKDFTLDIIGDGPERKKYENLSKKLGLEKFVRFHGLKTKVEIADFMRNSDFFVLPSLFETFGVVFIEAMACGLPIVATNVGGIPEIVKKECGILVPPANSEKLKKAIFYMLDNFKNYSKEKISLYVNQNFTHQEVGKKITDIYFKVLRGFKK